MAIPAIPIPAVLPPVTTIFLPGTTIAPIATFGITSTAHGRVNGNLIENEMCLVALIVRTTADLPARTIAMAPAAANPMLMTTGEMTNPTASELARIGLLQIAIALLLPLVRLLESLAVHNPITMSHPAVIANPPLLLATPAPTCTRTTGMMRMTGFREE
jgi:hypothetical protein